jgi:hypothetical protein
MKRIASMVGVLISGVVMANGCGGGGGTGGGTTTSSSSGSKAASTSTSTTSSSSSGSSGTGVIGDACTKTSDCGSGLYCSTSDPGGQCLKICMKQADCPSGSTCTDEMKCYKSCTMASDCTRQGYACVQAMTVDAMPTTTCDVAPPMDAGADG